MSLDNCANLLWDADWWQALLTSARYSFLVIALTFLPPVGLAILLQEVPRGKILFRLIFYLPATITGLVVILLWKTFYEPSEAGLMNRLVMAVPGAGWLLLAAALLLLTLHLVSRLLRHQLWKPALFVLAGGALMATAPLAPLREIWRGLLTAGAPTLAALLSAPRPPAGSRLSGRFQSGGRSAVTPLRARRGTSPGQRCSIRCRPTSSSGSRRFTQASSATTAAATAGRARGCSGRAANAVAVNIPVNASIETSRRIPSGAFIRFPVFNGRAATRSGWRDRRLHGAASALRTGQARAPT